MAVFFTLGLVAFVFTCIGVAAIRLWALRRNLLDIPNERSSHRVPTPRGGGLAMAIVVLLGFGLACFSSNAMRSGGFLGYTLGGIILAAISQADDIFEVSPKTRLVFQLFAAIILVVAAGFLNRVYFPFIGELNWGWLGLPITLFWIVGITNAYNFMDGVDGMAAGQAIVAGAFWLVICLILNLSALTVLTILLVGASLGFLLHNLPPARIFMGDVGSAFLGFTFAALPVLAYGQTANPRFFIAGVLCIVPFAFDTSLTLLRRALNQENVLQPHRTHLYQRLITLGYRHGPVSLLYALLAFLSGLAALTYLWASDLAGGLALLLVVCLLVLKATAITWRERRATTLQSGLNETALLSPGKNEP